MKQDPEFFGEQELQLLYIAKRLKEALRLEQALTESGVNYVVEPDRYRGGVIFQSERVGAFFYVDDASLESAREVMSRIGFRPFNPAE